MVLASVGWTLVLAAVVSGQAPDPAGPVEALWEAARQGDVSRIARLLDQGADVNAKTRYGVTALIFAADKGHLEAVKLLVARGADVDVQDTFYRGRPLDMALSNDHVPVALFLLEKGSKGGARALTAGIRSGNPVLVKAALAAPDLDAAALASAADLASKATNAEIASMVKAAAAAKPLPPTAAFQADPAALQSYAGTYRNESSGLTVTVANKDGALTAQAAGQPTVSLKPTAEAAFSSPDLPNLTVRFAGRGGMIERMIVNQGGNDLSLERLTVPAADASPSPPKTDPVPAETDPVARPWPRTTPRHWPSFRGIDASGNGDNQGAVAGWDVGNGRNLRWKTPIPGIANSSPIVWGQRVFVTTAVSSRGDATFRTGLYGDVKPVDDLSEHTWKVYCLDKSSGKVVWERTAFQGMPKVKRHTKASQANSTPATDGKRVVALFGSIGLLVAYDMGGKELWRADLGALDSGWFFDPDYQWGHSSSPILYRESVIVQADRSRDSFIAAWDLKSGKVLWKTAREGEVSTWGTPTVYHGKDGDVLVTNGTKIRGYDPASGKLRWTLGPNSEVTVATPVAGDGVVYVTAGYPPVRPIYAIRPSSSGDISLPQGQESSAAIAWSNSREGTYIPTPIVYGDYLYTCGNNGVVTAYQAKTGERVYRARVGKGGAFSASPVAADGRLYLANEDGEVYVVRAGPKLEELAKMEMKEVIMATPAISDGLIVLRTLGHVYGIGATDAVAGSRDPD